MEHSKLPFTARGSIIEDAYGLIVADTNRSCGLTRGLDLANAELLATCANLHGELVGIVQRLVNGITEYKLDATREGGVLGVAWCDARELLAKVKGA